ncbi:ATP-binding protein [Halostella salina]|uniref:ATP-binding protein n=1 Tax=Halostella salina TaxID=1547897 RepID=UPI001969ADF5|nr:ATP-binding protein [Halostella salina]
MTDDDSTDVSDQPPATDEATPTDAETVDDTDQYIRVIPTDAAVSPSTVVTHLKRLHALATNETDAGGLRRFFGAVDPETIECLLVADGAADSPVSYYFGISDPARLDALEGILAGLFPDTYELRRDNRIATAIPGLLGFSDAEDTANPDPSPATADGKHDGTIEPPERTQTAVEFQASLERRADWQTQLTSFETVGETEEGRIPLASVVETMASHSGTMVYQTLLRPKSDWTPAAEQRREALRTFRDTYRDQLSSAVFGSPDLDDEDVRLSDTDEARREEIAARETAHCFELTARAVAVSQGATSQSLDASALETVLSPVSGQHHRIRSRVSTDENARAVAEAIRMRTVSPHSGSLRSRLPGMRTRTDAIVTDPSEVGNFALLDGSKLTTDARRALAGPPTERTAIPRPPGSELTPYRTEGMTLGVPLSENGTASASPVSLPPELQALHLAWFGKTGSGKSIALVNAILDNHAASDGATILVDRKGDGMPETYMRAHKRRYGSLDDVYYFDCTKLLPAISFFDVRDQLAAGISRTTAVADVVDHHIEVLQALMGREQFERAVRSPDIIRYLVKALFDPVHGSDAYTYDDLLAATDRMRTTRDPPTVSDPNLDAMLAGVTTGDQRSYDAVMKGVSNRIEKVPVDDRLAQLFNHVPRGDDPSFDLRRLLDADVVIVFDTGGLRTESQRAITLVLLSQLFTALKRRDTEARGHDFERVADLEGRDTDTDGDADLSLVNLVVEEAAGVATTGLMADLLAQSRSFGLSVTLAMQFPGQLRERDPQAYAELLNNVSTVVTGNVAVDRDLAERLATADIDAAEMGTRLRAVRRGQWLVSLPAAFGEPEPRPFLVESVPLPPGHPEGADPYSSADERAFEAALTVVESRTKLECGIDVTGPTRNVATGSGTESTTATAGDQSTARAPADSRVDGADTEPPVAAPSNSTLPYTKRFPGCLEYDRAAHAICCGACERRYDATLEGLVWAVECCHSLDTVDRDDIPILTSNVTLTPGERTDRGLTGRKPYFLQAVYAAQHGQYDADLEYDLVADSMVRLQEYVGIDDEAVQELIDDGLLSQDGNYPHRLYTVTPEGRDAMGISHREGIAYGDGKGDLSESSLHVLMVEVGRRYIEQAFAEDEHSDVVEAVSYYEVGEHRLDAAGIDEHGNVIVTLEAERMNNDRARAVPDDYDKMATLAPEEAIWIVRNRDAAHDILEALNDPLDGPPRVEKTYSRNSPPQRFTIDTHGLTDIHTVQYVRDSLLSK